MLSLLKQSGWWNIGKNAPKTAIFLPNSLEMTSDLPQLDLLNSNPIKKLKEPLDKVANTL
jgi:hypothetical protein